MSNELYNTCPVCNEQIELSKEDFARGTYTCKSCFTVNKIDTNYVQPKSVAKRPKRKAIPLSKPVRFIISILQIAIVVLSLYGLYELMPSGIAYSLPVLASMLALWLQKIKMGYNPIINDNEYEVNPKDALRQEGYDYDPFTSTSEEYKRYKAEKEAGRKFTQKEWDEYYDKYRKEHPPMELTWENIKNRFTKSYNRKI